MFDSLRARLLLWYTAILALVIVLFGVAVCWQFWRSLVRGLDDELGGRAAAVAASLEPAGPGTFDLDLPPELGRAFRDPSEGAYYVIWNAAGDVVDRSDPDLVLPRPTRTAARPRGWFREVVVAGPGGAMVLVGRDTTDLRREVGSLAATVSAVAVLALGLALAGGWFLAGRALGPIARISATARAMSGGDLAARIAVADTESELEQVASTLNSAFDRLQLAVEQQRRFTADASHELRTPLATMSAEAEWALSRDRSPADYRESLETCHRAAIRMRAVVEGLLTLARADAGERPFHPTAVELVALAIEVAAMLEPIAKGRGVSIRRPAGTVTALADPDAFRLVVTNLVSNAIHYNREGGTVAIEAREEPDASVLEVTDTGIGIAADDLPRIFDRFYRADKARAREAGGAGLGLALVRWIVDGHDGTVECTSAVGEGTRFTVRLPRASPPGTPVADEAITAPPRPAKESA